MRMIPLALLLLFGLSTCRASPLYVGDDRMQTPQPVTGGVPRDGNGEPILTPKPQR